MLVVLVVTVVASSCGRDVRLTETEARRLLSESPAFQAPNVLRVRRQYCSNRTVREANEREGQDPGRLTALRQNGVIATDIRRGGPDECQSIPSGEREVIIVALVPGAETFHPREVEGGWEFTLATRRFVALDPPTFNDGDKPALAHVIYRWHWSGELLGQLLQVNEGIQGASATLLRDDEGWRVRDAGL